MSPYLLKFVKIAFWPLKFCFWIRSALCASYIFHLGQNKSQSSSNIANFVKSSKKCFDGRHDWAQKVFFFCWSKEVHPPINNAFYSTRSSTLQKNRWNSKRNFVAHVLENVFGYRGGTTTMSIFDLLLKYTICWKAERKTRNWVIRAKHQHWNIWF